MENLHWEPLAPACRVLVSREHTFNTDTILLAHFAAPKHKERCIDLGTGCGTISLLWQANYAPRHITAVELGEQAFSQALRSVSENGYEENIEVIRGDIREIKKIIPHPTFLRRVTRRIRPWARGCATRTNVWKTRGTSAPARLKMSRKRAETCCASAAGFAYVSARSALRTQ